jgi:hypothetical protein
MRFQRAERLQKAKSSEGRRTAEELSSTKEPCHCKNSKKSPQFE